MAIETLSQNARPINILLVDDDDEDVDLIERTLKSDRVLNTISRVANGVQALEFLRSQGEYTDAFVPDLILLDLNMPRMGGRDVLKHIKEDPKLDTIPVVIFTSSDDDRDVMESYKYQANSYITKPLDLVKFRSVLKEIRNYWFCVVTLPTPPTS